MGMATRIAGAVLGLCLLASGAQAAPYKVLWWDSTPEYWGHYPSGYYAQAANSLRQEMSTYLTGFSGGTLFSSTYVDSETPGTLAAQLGSNSYDVIVFDATSFSAKFNSADLLAVQSFYQNNSNVLLDGTLYVRSANGNAFTDFPGINDALGIFTANQVKALASRGGGIMIGTDHQGFQVDANQVLQAVIPGAAFSGITYPSTDGVFTGTELLTTAGAVAPADVFPNWSNASTQGIAPTGNFTDFLGNPVTLYSQVDVADKPGGGPRFSNISTSFAPGGRATDIDDPEPPVTGTPEPASLAMFGVGLLGLARMRRRRPTL